MNTQDREDAVTLGILETVDARSDFSQRHLADRLGVALGLANMYLKRCVRKGLVKIKQAPANRYLYYLTPKGFAEKSRLTAEYLSISFDFYRRAGESCATVFRECAERGLRRVLLGGVSELGEIASLRAEEHGIRIVGTFDPASERDRFVGQPLWKSLEEAAEYDACVLTALSEPLSLLNLLAGRVPEDRLFIPGVLGLTTVRNGRGNKAGTQGATRT